MSRKLMLVLLLIMVALVGVPGALAFPGQTNACDGCHTISASINVTTDVTSLTVSPGQVFKVDINWSGGLASGQTEVNWPTNFTNIGITRDNTLFNPTPRIPAPAPGNVSGTTASNLTAPAKPGSYIVRVYTSSGTDAAPDGTNFKDINVTVAAPTTLTTITVSPSTATLNVNGTQQFTATALDQNGTPVPGINISWTSSNSTVGNVNPLNTTTDVNGTTTTTFTALAPGTATVNATNGTVTGSAFVTVSPTPPPKPTLATITVSPSTVTLTAGAKQIFTATATDQNNTPIPEINISWTVSNSTVGSVNPLNTTTDVNGNTTTTFTALAPGTATVNATNGTVTGSADVTIIALPTTFSISGFKINNATGSGIPGWLITLENATTGAEIANTTTDATGFYQFTNLTNGTYNVTEETRANFTPIGQTSQTVTIAGQNATNINFTNQPVTVTFSISGFKINGTDNNGTGISDWNITLFNATTGAEITNTTTNSMGFYQFTNLSNGTYNVTEGIKTGWTNISPTTQTVTISGMNVPDINFTNALVTLPGSISGRKFNDLDHDGDEDPADLGLANWTIILNKSDGTTESTLTDTNGNYSFTNLTAGNYTVSEVLKSGWMQSFPASGTYNVTLTASQNVTGIDFGNFILQTFSISGFKINNVTGSGIPGWAISLENATTGTTIANTTTDATGFYQFTNLTNGTYNVTEETRANFTPIGQTSQTVTIAGQNATNINFTNQPIVVSPTFSISGFKINNLTGSGIPGWNITLTNDTMQTSTLTGTDGSYQFTGLANGTYNVTEETRANFTPIGPISQTVIIAGQNVTNINFTNMPTAKGSISGMKFNDSNGNRVKDENESGLADWQIDLNSSNGTTVATTTTGSGGTYTFGGIAPGNYTVQEVLKPGWRQTAPANGTYNITLSDNQNLTGLDFGNQLVIVTPTFSISGFKINNKTGSGIPGWNITLTNDTIQVSTLTDANGFYQFTGLANGTYNVTEETRADFTPIGLTSQTVTIAGQNVTNINFTNQPVTVTFSISGFKINGATGTGIQGWIIMLKNATTGAPIFNTTTDATGFYQFTNLANGTYNVTEETRADFTPTSATFQVVTIAGRSVTNVNFTNTPVRLRLGSISGFKIDIASGRGLPNWTIKLIGIVGKGTETRVIRMETTTNTDGFYKFDNLPAGRYILREELQGGFVPVGSPVKNIMLAQGENSMNNNFTNRPIHSLVNTDDIRDITNRALDNTDKDDIGDIANRALDNMDTDGLSHE